MIIQITGVTSGNSPYDVFLCDTGYTSCFLISGSCTIPPTVIIDTDYFFPNYNYVGLKLVDTNGCIITQNQVCIPAPTPTPTTSPTPTPTTTPTPTPTTTPTPTPVPPTATPTPTPTTSPTPIPPTATPTPTVSPTPTTSPTPTPTSTPTPTPTTSPTPTPTPTTDPKFVIAKDFDVDDYYVYDVGSNTETGPITLSGFTQAGSLANTATKFWINPPDGAIDEWNLTLSPVVATYNRGISNFQTYSSRQGLEAINDGRLIASLYVSGDGETQIFEVGISTSAATYTKITSLTGALSGSPLIYDIALSTTGDFIVLGGSGDGYYLQQYVYSASSLLDFEIDISASVPTPIGIVGYENKIHIMDSNKNLYRINETSPYAITLLQTAPRAYGYTTQSPGSVTTAFVS